VRIVRRSGAVKIIDLALSNGDSFATVEFKGLTHASVGYWIVSGKSADGLPAILLTLAVPMKQSLESDLCAEAEEFAREFLFPMAARLSETPAVGERIPPLNTGQRNWLFEEHMHYHFAKERSGSLTLQLQTQALFKMATYLEVVAPLKFIAEFQGVAVSTVETRIKKARAQGVIPKASDVRARNRSVQKDA